MDAFVLFLAVWFLVSVYSALARRVLQNTVFLSWVVFPILNRGKRLQHWTVTVSEWPPETQDAHDSWISSLPVMLGWAGWRRAVHHILGCPVCLTGWLTLLLCWPAALALLFWNPVWSLIVLASWPVAWYSSLHLR